ncbi:unnamed protein product [Caenorhabditis angaria]|uniref:AB hydrolase-1 domain-containing protein n=1 Tax=Caenorhabditis angaria TaxID=860376 RepID=A0A9P1MY03_9PELO|nr:unnamed protein product [Caenorhabditis angaria]
MGFLARIFEQIYTAYRQYLYTFLAILGLVWKRITEKEEYFREFIWARPEVLDDGWTHKNVQLKNIKLHYVEEGPADGDVLVMVHGFPEFWYSWRYQLNYFKKNYRCLALDMRGYSESEKPRAESQYNMTHLVEDIREFIEILAAGQKVVLAAHDWGAIVCWRVAIMYPELLKKLIILNVPHPSAFREVLAKSPEQRAKSWYIYFFQSPSIPELYMRLNKMEMLEKMLRSSKHGVQNRANFTDQDMEAWKYTFSQAGSLTGPINYYRQIFKAQWDNVKDKTVKIPVMIIWGDRDAFLEVEGAEITKKYCISCRVQIIEGASHWVQQDQPEKVNKFMEQFMSQEISSKL